MTAVDRAAASGRPAAPSAAVRVAGWLGLLGGAALLAAFAIEIPHALNGVRLVLFFGGAIAVGAAIYPWLAVRARAVARPAVGFVVVANAWGLAMTLVSIAFAIPVGPGTFGVLFFWAGLAWWLADALFGLVAVRIGGWPRLGALVLSVGSILALTGMDRLELTTRANPTIFLPLSLIGIALNGMGWIVLGVWLINRRDSPTNPVS